jgi:hypothetical protein
MAPAGATWFAGQGFVTVEIHWKGGVPTFRFDEDRLLAVAKLNQDRYRTADPFPHAVIDGLVPAAVLDAVLAEFPGPGDQGWFRFDSQRERKLASAHERGIGDATLDLLNALNSATFLRFLEELTGIAGLVPDPWFLGGGLHQIEPGGYLDVHADFNLHPHTGLERQLNLLLYLNRDWAPEYGGQLELWSHDMRAKVVGIEPVFNRIVIFTTNEMSYHGHPEPLRCPEGRTRRSLALYYYALPSEPTSVAHNTLFQDRGQSEIPAISVRVGGRIRAVAREWLPPAVVRGLRTIRVRVGRER